MTTFLGRFLRWVLFAVGGLAAFAVLAFVAVFGLAQSEAGRAWIAATVTRAASTPGELEITLERLDGALPRSLSLHGLTLADGDGVWLRLKSASLEWRPMALWNRTLHISEIAVTGLEVARAPTTPSAPDEAPSEDLSLPSLPVALVLERLSVEDLSLGAPLLGVPLRYRITGQGASDGTERLGATLTVERSDGIAGRLTLEASLDLPKEHLRANLALDEPAGGLIAQLTGQPDLPPLAMRFVGDGGLANWRGQFSATVEDLAEAELDVTLHRTAALEFGLDGWISAEAVGEESPWSLLAGKSDIEVAGAWRDEQALDLRTLKIEAPFGALEASGQVDVSGQRVELHAAFSLHDTARLAPLMAPARFESASLDLAASGPLMQPDLTLDLAVEALSAPQVTVEGIEVQARFQPDGPLDQGQVAGAFSVQGLVRQPLLEGQEALVALIGDVIPFGIDGRVDLAGNRLELSTLSLDTADLGLAASGQMDLASLAAEVEAALDVKTLAGLTPLTGLEPHGAGRFTMRAQVAPEIQSIDAEVDAGFSDFALSDPALAEPAAALLGAAPKVHLAATFEPAGRLTVRSLTFEGQAFSADATADIGLEPLAGQANATVYLSDLSELAGTVGVPLGGAVEITGEVDLAEQIAATLEARLRDFAIDDPAIAPWLDALAGAEPSLVIAAKLDQDGAVRLDGFDLQGAAVRASVQGTLPPGYETLALRYDLELAELDVLSEPLGLPVAGDLRLTGSVDGAVADPSVSANLLVKQGQVDAAHFSQLETEVAAETVVSAPKAQVNLTLATPQGDFKGEANLALEADVLKIPTFGLRAEGATIDGELSAPLDGAPVKGELRADLTTLTPWLGLAGLDGGGALTANAVLGAQGRTQTATVKAHLSDLAFQASPEEKLTLGAVELFAETGDLTGALEASVTVKGSELSLGEFRLDTFSAKGSGGATQARFALELEGQAIEPLSLSTAGQVEMKGQAVRLTLASLDGSLIGEEIHLKSPLRLRQEGGTFALNDLNLSFGTAALTGDARMDKGGVAADLRLQDLPLQLARLADPTLDLGGTLSAQLSLQGALTDPRGAAALNIKDLQIRDLEDAPKVSSEIEADWRGGQLALTGTVSGIPGGGAVFAGRLPLRLVPETYAVDLPQDQPISGEMTWRGRLGRLWTLAPLDGHEADGEVDLQVALSGTLADPQVAGHLDLNQGFYENLDSGTLLKDLSVKMSVDQAHAVNLSVNTSDGGKGRLSVEGDLKIAPEDAFPFDITTEFQEFTLVRRDDVTARANGRIRLHGNAERADLVGEVETRRIEIRLIDALPPAVADLEVIEEDGAQAEAIKAREKEKAAPFDLGLDLAVAMPARVYVRGRGLDSEWAGNLKVAGSAAEPRIDGELSLVRGTLALVGKSFRLDSGRIRFAGGERIDPLIDVAAVHKGDGFTATIRLAGRATQPELIMTAIPELPQDEILARVLFDKSASELSTTEALQFAAAVAELTGKGGDSALDTARKMLGVDVLRLENSEDGSTTPSVAAGKYVADNVYVGVKQGAAATSSAVEVEIELTPNISVGSEMGQDGNSNVGIQFKWDY